MDLSKQFISLLEGLARRHDRYRVFNDFVSLLSIELNQAARLTVGLPKEEHDEKIYLEVMRRYEQDEQHSFVEMFAMVINGLENEKGDWLGNIFSQLSLGNPALGQFFTPYPVAKMMGTILCPDKDVIQQQINQVGYLIVNEPACGSGVMVIAFAEAFREAGFDTATQLLVVAQDINSTIAGMCHIQLSLYGIPALVECRNTLTQQFLWRRYTPVYYWLGWPQRILRHRNEREPVESESSTVSPVTGQSQSPAQPLLFGGSL
jgi:hypothetical protein